MPLFLDSDRSGSRAELNAGICITIGLINNMRMRRLRRPSGNSPI